MGILESPASPILKGWYVIRFSRGLNPCLRPVPKTQGKFKGEILHTTEFTSANKNAGKKVVIIGAGTSAHDVAEDHVKSGAGEVVRYHLVDLAENAQFPDMF